MAENRRGKREQKGKKKSIGKQKPTEEMKKAPAIESNKRALYEISCFCMKKIKPKTNKTLCACCVRFDFRPLIWTICLLGAQDG
jgi:hypothetical protein